VQQFRHVYLVAALLTGTAMSAAAAPQFQNTYALPATTQDLSGDAGINSRVGMFSDLYYDPNRNEWWGVSDRGAGGGTLPYDTRVQRFTIDFNAAGAITNVQVAQTIKFTAPLGNLNGIAPSPTNVLGKAFDPEGFVVHPTTGRFLVSDEYGPSVYEFNRDGSLYRTYNTPANLIPRNTGTGTPNFASDAGNNAGKRTNRGFEGLAITPDGKYAYAMLQSAMLDEGAGDGRYSRIVKFDTNTGEAVAQYAYQMEGSSRGRGISSLVALNENEFLVLERNNRGVGVDAELTPSTEKAVFKIDLSAADDVSGITLPLSGALPGGLQAANKQTPSFLDLSAIGVAELGNRVPEKLEGLTIGPKIGDKFVIVLGTDNDYSVTQDASTTQFDEYINPANLAANAGVTRLRCDLGVTDLASAHCVIVNANASLGGVYGGPFDGFTLLPGILYAFTIGEDEFTAYQAPIPEPATLGLLGLGLAGLATLRRRRG
jgi:hypothetical protein